MWDVPLEDISNGIRYQSQFTPNMLVANFYNKRPAQHIRARKNIGNISEDIKNKVGIFCFSSCKFSLNIILFINIVFWTLICYIQYEYSINITFTLIINVLHRYKKPHRLGQF